MGVVLMFEGVGGVIVSGSGSGSEVWLDLMTFRVMETERGRW